MTLMTLLYHFASDSWDLPLAEGIRIVAMEHYHGPSFDEEVGKYMQAYEPSHILFFDPLLSAELVIGAKTSLRFLQMRGISTLSSVPPPKETPKTLK